MGNQLAWVPRESRSAADGEAINAKILSRVGRGLPYSPFRTAFRRHELAARRRGDRCAETSSPGERTRWLRHALVTGPLVAWR